MKNLRLASLMGDASNISSQYLFSKVHLDRSSLTSYEQSWSDLDMEGNSMTDIFAFLQHRKRWMSLLV